MQINTNKQFCNKANGIQIAWLKGLNVNETTKITKGPLQMKVQVLSLTYTKI